MSGAVPATAPLHEAALTALRRVADPEMAENIVDLGLIERIEQTAEALIVTLIPTSATCPMADVIIDDAVEALQRICPPELTAQVEMDWDIAWSPERLSPALKARFGW